MSGEIKFKVWVKSRSEMTGGCSVVNEKLRHEDLRFLQFTGLKDKNGVELFDGDIYVQWGRVCKCDFEHTIYEKMNSLIFDGDFEVIGNIYENPELLEAKK